jgi:hypothetical protein
VVVPPANQTAVFGTDAAFNVSVFTRPTRIFYQWKFNGADIALATNRSLVITNVQAGDLGNYSVLVTMITNTTMERLFTASLGLPAVDTDNDGMPDDWENQYACLSRTSPDASADADADGMTNLAEYQAGTDPCDDLSYLKVELPELVGIGATNVALRFAAVSNKTYSILYQEVLDLTNTWSKLRDVDGAPTNRAVEVIDVSPTAPQRFYRLVTPRQ